MLNSVVVEARQNFEFFRQKTKEMPVKVSG